MTLIRHLLSGAAVLALTCGAARAQDSATPVAPPPKVESSPIAPAAPKPAATQAPVAPAPSPSAAEAKPAAPAPSPTAAASAPASPTPAATPASAPGEALPAEPIPVEIAPKPKKKPKPAPPPLETALSTDPTPTLSPQTFYATQKAAERYAHIVEQGGWATDLPPLHPGAHGEDVAKLRKHLELEGDLPAGPLRPKWDGELTAAVKRFQARMGLRETGAVAGETLKAMDVPAEVRRLELAASAARLSGLHFDFSAPRYVVVNLPSTSVEAVQGGQVAHRYVAIVGDPDHPSPEISANISVINLNPTWTVPTSIIKKEIIPHMQRDASYLSREHIRILDGQLHEVDARSVDWSSERASNYILRQDSGAGNSLGSIRIGMPNKLAVYMHDTPGKALFGRDFRFLSHGCVRVQGVYDYAAWLLEDTPAPTGVWDKEALLDKQRSKERFDIKLTRSVPVIWVYLTGWANEEGTVNFRNDVYGLDPAAEANAAAAAARAEQSEAEASAGPSAPAPSAPLSISPIFNFLSNNH